MESASTHGLIFGVFDENSSLVANVCNFSTGYMSPQFHLVFDDLFETVIINEDDDKFLTTFAMICST